MTLRLCVRAAVLAAAASLLAAPAMAEITKLDQLSKEQGQEIYCLHDELWFEPESFTLAVKAFLHGDDVEEAEAAVKKTGRACATRYKWDQAKLDLGLQAGLASAVNSYLIEELYGHGATDADVAALDRAIRKMPEKDAVRFLDDSWLEDAAFIKRVDALLVAEKFPHDEHLIESAHLIMEAHLRKSVSAMQWVRTYINKKN